MSSSISVRSFNQEGMETFFKFLTETKKHEEKGLKRPVLPIVLLRDQRYLENNNFSFNVNANQTFNSRYDLGRYLYDQCGKDLISLHYNNSGLWTWFAVLWFAQFRSLTSKKTNRFEHYIPYEWFPSPQELFNSHAKLGYRHCVRTPVEAYVKLGAESKFFLSKKISSMGDATEQLLSTPRILSSKKLRDLIIYRYSDKNGYPEKGALDYVPTNKSEIKKKKGYGKLRRLTDAVLPRFKLTFDIDKLENKKLLKLCGDEFKK